MASLYFDERTATFLSWFSSLSGATFSHSIGIVDFRDRDAGRGIIATQDVPAGMTLFTIPRPNIINVETSDLGKVLPGIFEFDEAEDEAEEDAALDSWSSLILVMIYEFLKGDKSPWKPYFDVLPDSFNTLMFWSDGELHELQTSSVRAKIGKTDAEAMFRSKLLPIIRKHSNVFETSQDRSEEELIALAHRMGSTIMAYAFDLENDEEKDEDEDEEWVEDREGRTMMGMVPMADILNADAEFNAHVNHEDKSLVVTSLRPIQAGEEILNYYGPHPNSELLRRYGYVTEKHSRHDVVEIPWELIETAMMSQLELSKEDVTGLREQMDDEEFEDTFVLERESGEPTSEGLLPEPSTLSGLPADLDEQLKAFLKELKKTKPNMIPDKRKRDDLKTSILLHTLRQLQQAYPTSIPEDEALLKGEDVSLRKRMAVMVRLGEKRLLEEAVGLLSENDVDVEMGENSAPTKRTRA